MTQLPELDDAALRNWLQEMDTDTRADFIGGLDEADNTRVLGLLGEHDAEDTPADTIMMVDGVLLDGEYQFSSYQPGLIYLWRENIFVTQLSDDQVAHGDYGVITFNAGEPGARIVQGNQAVQYSDDPDGDASVDEIGEDAADAEEEETEEADGGEDAADEGVGEVAEDAYPAFEGKQDLADKGKDKVLDEEDEASEIEASEDEAGEADAQERPAQRDDGGELPYVEGGEVQNMGGFPELLGNVVERNTAVLHDLFADVAAGEHRSVNYSHGASLTLIGDGHDFAAARLAGPAPAEGKITFRRNRVGANEIRIGGPGASNAASEVRHLIRQAGYPYRDLDRVRIIEE